MPWHAVLCEIVRMFVRTASNCGHTHDRRWAAPLCLVRDSVAKFSTLGSCYETLTTKFERAAEAEVTLFFNILGKNDLLQKN